MCVFSVRCTRCQLQKCMFRFCSHASDHVILIDQYQPTESQLRQTMLMVLHDTIHSLARAGKRRELREPGAVRVLGRLYLCSCKSIGTTQLCFKVVNATGLLFLCLSACTGWCRSCEWFIRECDLRAHESSTRPHTGDNPGGSKCRL